IVPALRQRYRSHQAARNPQVAVASAWPPFIRHCRILVDAWTADARYAFLAAWIVAPLVLLEPLQTRLVHYYLPAYPAWALLLGAFLAGLASRRGPARAGCAAFGYEMLAGYGVLGLLAAAAALLSLPRPLGPPLALTVAVGGSLCSAAWIALRRRHLRLGAVLLGTATASLCASAAWWVIPAAGPLRLAQHVAERMRWHAGTGPTVLFGFEEPSVIYYLGGDIPTPATPQQLEERLRRTGPAISALPPPVVEALRESGLFDIQRLEVVSGYDLNKGRCQQVQIVRIALPNTGA
ncbi:MAG: hypothetical protein HY000_41365, partial [Planctomycetes bacterium]|nr:hypothetical protein [Planctomycetota bacterium]